MQVCVGVGVYVWAGTRVCKLCEKNTKRKIIMQSDIGKNERIKQLSVCMSECVCVNMCMCAMQKALHWVLFVHHMKNTTKIWNKMSNKTLNESKPKFCREMLPQKTREHKCN